MTNCLDYKKLLSFYQGKRVLLTGNTGFKGSWMTHILLSAGAKVFGYARKPPTTPALFTAAGIENHALLTQVYADVRDIGKLKQAFYEFRPEIVFHLAAQPIVRDSFKDPVDTFATNVMGTVNVCESVRLSHIPPSNGGLQNGGWHGVRSMLNVTTDKVYRNHEWEWGYRENDELGGSDPYSSSKSCAELVTHSYRDSFFHTQGYNGVASVSTARAGNVIGGGDFANDRIMADCVRGLMDARNKGENTGEVIVRNPYSVRPYEHVLEPLFAYLLIAEKQYKDPQYAGCYNVGPDGCDCVTTGGLVDLFSEIWNRGLFETNFAFETGHIAKHKHIYLVRVDQLDPYAPHEANFLKLDCSKMKSIFHWAPRWNIQEAVKKTAAWTKVWLEGADAAHIRQEMDWEIETFIAGNEAVS